MSFEKAGNFLFVAADKYKLGHQAKASLVCERTRKTIAQHYPRFVDYWEPIRSENGILTIQALDAAAAELFIRSHELLEHLQKVDFPEKITEIRIQKY
jgi:hypothetical protein